MTRELEDSSNENTMKLTCDVCVSLKNENGLLNDKVSYLTKIVHNFTNEKKNVDLILGGQSVFLTKEVLDTNIF